MAINSIRSVYLFCGTILILCGIWVYIGFLQLYYHAYFKDKSISNCTRFQEIEGLRGIITDCKGIPIAITRPVFQLIWHKLPKKLSEEDNNLIKFLDEITNSKINLEELYAKNQDNSFVVYNNVPFTDLSLFLENFPTTNRITVNHFLERNYPHKNLFAHLIGYLHKIDKKGLFGLEKICDMTLTGKKGLIQNTVNAKGKILSKELLINPESGNTIETTVDYAIQVALAESFPSDESGCGIVINANTGAIKGLISYPNFDPHIFLHHISKENWDFLVEENALLNRAFQAHYPPGSLYKLVVALTLLEEKIINEQTTWFCGGYAEYKGRKYHCSNRTGHGLVSISDALVKSCNIPFFSVAINGLSIDTIYKYAVSFGLGQKTSCFFDELAGIIPNKQWKKKKLGLPWYSGETLSACIGQGLTTVTPIQISKIIMGIMQGYIINPYIIADEKKEKIILSYKKENLHIIQESMKTSTAKGSSKKLSSLRNWVIYAKTGTAQVCALDYNKNNNDNENDENITGRENEKSNKKLNHHGLFACYAKHKNCDPLILVLVIEHNKSSQHTVSVAKKFFELYEQTLPI